MTHLDTLCVELTARCPLQCTHCSVGAGPERREFLALATFADCLAQSPGLAEIFLSGGEPFEHPNFLEFVSLSKRSARSVVVYSSGTRIERGQLAPLPWEQIAAAAGAGVERIDVSLYGSSAIHHDAVTQTHGSFEHTVETLRRLRLAGVPFGIHYVPVADRGAGMLSVTNLARVLGASRFHVLSVAPQGRARRLPNLLPQPSFYDDVRELWSGVSGLRVVLSSRMRREAGITEGTARDSMRAAMLDSAGFLYPDEGRRQAEFRSSRSLASGAPLAELLSELTAN